MEKPVKQGIIFFRREHVGLASIILLAIALRLIFLGQRGIWYDDAFSILLAKQPLAVIFSGTAADTMPPLYYLLLHYWMKISTQIIWIRLLNLVIFLGLLGMVYKWVAHLDFKRAGLLAAFFCSISPFLVYHTQEIRMYMLLAFFQIAYLYFFTSWLDEKENNQHKVFYAIAMILCGAGALYSHNLAIFGLVIPGLYLLIKRNFSRLWRWMAFLMGSMVLFIPWLVFVPGQIDKIQTAFWTPQPGVLEIIQAIYSLFSFLPQPNLWTMISGVVCFQILALLIWEGVKQRREIKHFWLIVFGIGFIPLSLFIVSYLMRPVFVARGFILSSVVVYSLAGILIAKKWGAGPDKIILALMIVLSGISLPFLYTYAEFPRSPFSQACTYLSEALSLNNTDGVIIHDNKLSYFPCYVYQPELPQYFLADKPKSHNDTFALASQQAMQIFPVESIEQALHDEGNVYFMVFTRALEEYDLLKMGSYPPLEYLGNEYQVMDIKYINDLAIYHYVKKTN